jgi:membrane protein implicated in regulation of membrane protease activity
VTAFFEKFRLLLWGLAAGVVGLYLYGLFLGLYSPLQLGLLSAVCLALIILFGIHELRLRRELRAGTYHDEYASETHAAKERRGF